jgi:hypothetical protein
MGAILDWLVARSPYPLVGDSDQLFNFCSQIKTTVICENRKHVAV